MTPHCTALLAAVLASTALAPAVLAQEATGVGQVRALQEKYARLQADTERRFAELTKLPEDEREAAGDRIYGEFVDAAGELTEKVVEIVLEQPEGEVGIAAITAALGMRLGKSDRAIVVEALSEHHAVSPTIIAALPGLRGVSGDNVDRLLKKVLDANPDQGAKGNACLVLAYREEDTAAREQLFERCVTEFGDAPSGDATVGTIAEKRLSALRNIKVGKAPPDIEGKDMDGVAFKLSDYRGKVVILDFWGYW